MICLAGGIAEVLISVIGSATGFNQKLLCCMNCQFFDIVFPEKKALSWLTRTFKNLKLIPRSQENLDLSVEAPGDFSFAVAVVAVIFGPKKRRGE